MVIKVLFFLVQKGCDNRSASLTTALSGLGIPAYRSSSWAVVALNLGARSLLKDYFWITETGEACFVAIFFPCENEDGI